jgi:hypothetical protein
MNHHLPRPTRRQLLQAGLALTTLGGSLGTLHAATSAPGAPWVDVWPSPGCGCCRDWVRHIEAAGLRARVHDSGQAEARARLRLPGSLASCHTAEVGGYGLEGHVPAREIQRLLRERPQAVGLVVPAMPVGSPGMDGPEYHGRRDPYDVLLVLADGRTRVYQSYR